MDSVNAFTVEGLTVKLYQDEDATNPREDFDNAGTMVCWHKSYTLGDKHSFAIPSDFEEWAKANKALVLPLYLYDHSGITMRTSEFGDPWDSGQVGYIYILPEKIHEEWGKGPHAYKKARICLVGEVETYDMYLRGDVYGYVVEDEEGKSLDSCWGFFGQECAEEEARAAAKSCAETRREKRAAKLKTLIKNKVPLEKRAGALS